MADLDEPNMSDTTLLVSVEDLINMAMGPSEKNVVNFKLIQTVLHILARNMRMLEQRVEIRITDEQKKEPRKTGTAQEARKSRSPEKEGAKERSAKREVEKAERAALKEKEKEERAASKDRDRADRAVSMEREKAEKVEAREREKEEKAAAKDKEKAAIAEYRESEKAEREAAKERERAERAASKEREKEERAASKEREKAERASSKEREKAEKAADKEREKAEKAAEKDKDKAEGASSKEREKAEKAAAKEREKAEKAAEKDKDKAERASSKEREKAEKASEKEKEKTGKATEKDKDKAERASSKEREKPDKAAEKEREKAAEKGDKAASKDKEKAAAEKGDKAALKDKEKAAAKGKEKEDKASAKDKEKEDKAAAAPAKDKGKTDKEKEKADKEKEKAEKAQAKEREKAAAKEREKAEKEKAEKEKAQKEKADKLKAEKEKRRPSSKERKSKAASDTSIVVSEVERRKEKVLVVEKGPTTRASESRRGSIEVVTRSQFDIVQNMVKELQQRAGPLPPPALPDNKKLMKDLAKGNASLNDTMQAMQVTARVRAAEKAIGRMGEMLTALAAAGALPADFVMEDIKFEPPEVGSDTTILPEKGTTRDGRDRKSVAIDPTTMPSEMSQTDDASLTSTGAAGAAGGGAGAGAAGAGAAAGLPAEVSGAGAGAGRPSSAAVSLAAASVGTDKSRQSMAISSAGRPSVATATSRMSTATSGGLGRPSIASRASVLSGVAGVTHPEMDSAIRDLRDELTKTVQLMTTKATIVAETASASAKAVAEKLEIALKLDTRISTLNSLVSDYAEQLSGFDSGLTTQMSSFRDQLTQMQAELGAGLKQLEVVNNNAETAAVMELTERYEGLVADLDQTMNTHRALTTFQSQLGVELHSLVECVEMLREQKADRDEVLDGLRDKADNSRLAGLLTVAEFNMARQELEKRLDVCHDKFRRQENVWMTALKDLKHVTQTKAEIMQLLAARERAEQMLLELQERQERLAVILGEPKAAMLTRALARGAVCGSCMTPALMEPQDESYGAPPALPAMRPRPVGADDDEPCMPEWKPPEPPDNREHTCHRWCGGSHTLLSEAVTRERAPPVQLQEAPTKRYTGYGDDGRLYMLEEELQPCVECNKFPGQPPDEPAPAQPADGAGDQGPPPETV